MTRSPVDELWMLGVNELREGILRSSWSARHVVDSIAVRISEVEPRLHAWAHIDLDRVAAVADGMRYPPEADHGLAGVPIGVKDVISTCDLPTMLGTEDGGGLPAEDAGVVGALRAAGALIPGKTATTSFAGPDPAPTVNPWRADRTPGGSSAGSAAAVAAGMVPAALGTQTAGSVLRPAAYCGVVGFKPTFGAIPVHGVFPLAPSLDTVGIMARSVGDVASVFAFVRSPGGSGRRSRHEDPGDREEGEPARIRLLACAELVAASTREHCCGVAAQLASDRTDVLEVHLPISMDELADAQAIIVRAEASRVHAQMVQDHRRRYEPGMRALIEAGRHIDDGRYATACQLQRELTATVDSWLPPGEVLLLPTFDGPVPDRTTTGSPALQAPFTFLGMPALTIPTGTGADGMPLAIQVIGRRHEDDRLLRVGGWIERSLETSVLFPLQDHPLQPHPLQHR